MYPELKTKYDWIKAEFENGELVYFYVGNFQLRLIASIEEVFLGDNYLFFDNGDLIEVISDTKLYSTRMEFGKPAFFESVENYSFQRNF